MSSRAREYHQLIEEILAEDASLRSCGLPGLDDLEIMEVRDMLARVCRKMLRNKTKFDK
jgi:hypothetical protein